MSKKQNKKLLTSEILKQALIGSIKKLDPRYMIKNPVMFVVEIGFLITLLLTLVPGLFGEGDTGLRTYNLIVSIILLLTVLFANFAESVAEGRGKAQAASLKKTQKDTEAHLLDQDGNETIVSSSELKKGDVVRVPTMRPPLPGKCGPCHELRYHCGQGSGQHGGSGFRPHQDPGSVEIGMQLLITRGSLTTFSIANDIAKYFAIIPAMFMAAIPQLGVLNVMHLSTQNSAILSALIFNAIIIPCLIPLAMKGVKYRPMSSGKMLARNMMIYGLGGVVTPFIGIKIIDMLVAPLLTAMGI